MATHKTSNVLAISVLAGLAGAGIALLLAPRSGRETRQKIHDKTDDLKHEVEDNLDRAKMKMQHQTEKLKAWKEYMARKALEKGEQAKETLDSSLDDARSELSDYDSTTLNNWEEEV